MQVHDTRDVLDVRNATVAGSRFDDVNMSNVKIEKALTAGMMINGVQLSDLFEAYEAAQAARSN